MTIVLLPPSSLGCRNFQLPCGRSCEKAWNGGFIRKGKKKDKGEVGKNNNSSMSNKSTYTFTVSKNGIYSVLVLQKVQDYSTQIFSLSSVVAISEDTFAFPENHHYMFACLESISKL